MARKARGFHLTVAELPVVREHPLQVAVARVLTTEIAAPGHLGRHAVVWFALDLASYRGDMPFTHIQRGCISGLNDIWILWLGCAFCIELKASDGVMSDAQKSVSAAFLMAGGRYAVATSIDDVLRILDQWGVPRRHLIEPQPLAA